MLVEVSKKNLMSGVKSKNLKIFQSRKTKNYEIHNCMFEQIKLFMIATLIFEHKINQAFALLNYNIYTIWVSQWLLNNIQIIYN